MIPEEFDALCRLTAVYRKELERKMLSTDTIDPKVCKALAAVITLQETLNEGREPERRPMRRVVSAMREPEMPPQIHIEQIDMPIEPPAPVQSNAPQLTNTGDPVTAAFEALREAALQQEDPYYYLQFCMREDCFAPDEIARACAMLKEWIVNQ